MFEGKAMSEAKHTPGSWWVTDSGIRDRGGYICHTKPPCHYPGQDARYEQEKVERAANKDLIAAAPEMLEALQWREQFEPRQGEDANECFERIAEVFQRETGHLRPGKDCVFEPYEIRQAAWDTWMEAGRTRVRIAIAKATGQPHE
jgi:hypothetical protein